VALDGLPVERSGRGELELIHLVEKSPAVVAILDLRVDLDLCDPTPRIDPEVDFILSTADGPRPVGRNNDEFGLGRENRPAFTSAPGPLTTSDAGALPGSDATSRSCAGARTTPGPGAAADPEARHEGARDLSQLDARGRGGNARHIGFGKLEFHGRRFNRLRDGSPGRQNSG
jgi:hypothetical protein